MRFIEEALIEQYGERCPDYASGCPCCKAWEEFDRITGLENKSNAAMVALEFYADISKYPAPLTGGMGELWSDCGAVARAALEDYNEVP